MIDLSVNQKLRSHLASNLARFEYRAIRNTDKKEAAVAVVVTSCEANTTAAFILTVRSSKLINHRGQYALPGGRLDPGESAEQAALREMHEEIGLDLDNSHILGRLDDYATRSGYVITPVVVWAGNEVELSANPDEVETIHRVPLEELLREDAPILEKLPDSRHPVLKMPIGDRWFAAPTAAIAYQFREVAILGKSTRVVHFEQPYFARQ